MKLNFKLLIFVACLVTIVSCKPEKKPKESEENESDSKEFILADRSSAQEDSDEGSGWESEPTLTPWRPHRHFDGGVSNLIVFPEEQSRALLLSNIDRLGRIVYGSLASVNQFPHFGYAVLYRSATQTFCGSTLIAAQWTVTAAHCMRDVRGAQIYFGGNDKNYMPTSQSIRFFIIHPQYESPSPLMNDIALMQLTSALRVTTTVVPIQLPSRSDVSKVFTGTSVIAAGFGKTLTGYPRYLQWTYLNALSNDQCLAVHWVFRDTMLCAKGVNGYGSSICFGDSGGPLITDVNGVKTFVGVNSYVQTSDCVSDVQGFTRVDRYLDWISSYTGLAIRW